MMIRMMVRMMIRMMIRMMVRMTIRLMIRMMNRMMIRMMVVPLSLDVKNDVLAPITEPSNDDYDNGVSDNCDQNFGTFDDFGVKNDQKVSHNMILMSKYKGQHGGKTGSKNSGKLYFFWTLKTTFCEYYRTK